MYDSMHLQELFMSDPGGTLPDSGDSNFGLDGVRTPEKRLQKKKGIGDRIKKRGE